MEKPELDLKQSPVDRMTMLLNMGFSRDEVFWDMMEHCGTSFESGKKKQALADWIAQLDRHNVFATGTIPEPPK